MDWGLVRLKNHWNPSNWKGDSKIGVGGQTAKLLRLLRERTYISSKIPAETANLVK